MVAKPCEIVAQTRKLVDDFVGLAGISRLDVAALVLAGRVGRELRHQHSEFGIDFGQPRAVAFAGKRRLALGPFGGFEIGFDLQLLRGQPFAFLTRPIQRAVALDDAMTQAFDPRVQRARLFGQTRDVGQQNFARVDRALVVIVENSEPGAGCIAIGGEARKTLANVGRTRRRLGLTLFRRADRPRALGQRAFELRAFGVSGSTTAVRSVAALVLALARLALQSRQSVDAFARGPHARFRRDEPRPTQPLRLRPDLYQLHFDLCQAAEFVLAGFDGSLRALGAPAATPDSPRDSPARSSTNASRSVRAWTRRDRIDRSRWKRPPVMAPPPVICSPPRVTTVSRNPRERTKSIPVCKRSTIKTLPTRKFTTLRKRSSVSTNVCA